MTAARRLASKPWWAAAGAALVVAALAGCDPSSGGAGGRPSAGCAAPSGPVAGTDGRADAAPGGGGLAVTAKGFTQLSNRGFRVSLGAEVENTSGKVAYRTLVTFSYTDAQQQSAVPADSRQLTLAIPVILPGQRVPVGTWAYVRTGSNGAPVHVADVQVQLGAVRWAARDAGFAELSARAQAVTRDGNPVIGTVTYSTNSGYCRTLSPRGIAMVFRDSSGAVVGGNIDLGNPHQKCAPGTTTTDALAIYSLPPGMDDSKTEVYPYCDPAPAPPTTGPGGPFN